MSPNTVITFSTDDLDILLVALGELHTREQQRVEAILKTDRISHSEGTRMALQKWVASIQNLRDNLKTAYLTQERTTA